MQLGKSARFRWTWARRHARCRLPPRTLKKTKPPAKPERSEKLSVVRVLSERLPQNLGSSVARGRGSSRINKPLPNKFEQRRVGLCKLNSQDDIPSRCALGAAICKNTPRANLPCCNVGPRR